jgi:hypothetical protein
MLSIEEFCRRHNACREGRKWAVENCETMEDVWRDAKPSWLVWVATRPDVQTVRGYRLLTLHAANSVRHFLTDERISAAIDVGQRYVDGRAEVSEVVDVSHALHCLSWGHLRAPAHAAALAASYTVSSSDQMAWNAAAQATHSAASCVARAAASAATADVNNMAPWIITQTPAWKSAWEPAWDATFADFAAWLRANATPCFERPAPWTSEDAK